MKAYKKKNLKYKNGYIMCGDRVVAVDNRIVAMANKLEYDLQKAQHEAAHQPCCCEPEPFEFTSERKYPMVSATTPALDEAVAQTLAIMEDLDEVAAVDKINACLGQLEDLVQFARDKRIVTCKQDVQLKFDVPTLGNPLKWDGDSIVDAVVDMYTA